MWLVGMMGSGKTLVGRLAAERIGVSFYDTDLAIVDRAGSSIAEIWRKQGENVFRDLESQAISEAPTGVVASAGGGAVLDPNNRKTMQTNPPVIWLRATPETLLARVGDGNDRPLLATSSSRVEELRRILKSRESEYELAATRMIDTDDREPDDIAREVSELWPD